MERSRRPRAGGDVADRLGQPGKTAAGKGTGELLARMCDDSLHHMSMSALPALTASAMAESALADGGMTDGHGPVR